MPPWTQVIPLGGAELMAQRSDDILARESRLLCHPTRGHYLSGAPELIEKLLGSLTPAKIELVDHGKIIDVSFCIGLNRRM